MSRQIHARSLVILLFYSAITVQIAACVSQPIADPLTEKRFTIAVIPDTQNYADYSHQKSQGFAIDAGDLFLAQMEYIASNAITNDGDIVFVASVGDVWQHQSKAMDDAHAARGFKPRTDLPSGFNDYLGPKDGTLSFELPKAREAYQLISDAGLPFGVAPGNHDYDAMWSVAGYQPDYSTMSKTEQGFVRAIGTLHVGGLDNFRSVFGEDTAFFADKPWYVASYKGGTSSAQTFNAGGYQFLHIALEMQPGDDVIRWAETVIADHNGKPTIISTHDYLNTQGERVANPLVNLAAADPEGNNSPQQMWDKLFSQHEQIFVVLCGHQHGQNYRVDKNMFGQVVHQVLADYQDRGQVAIDAGQPLDPVMQRPVGIGDGWFRLMQFDLNSETPHILIKTFSSHYKKFSAQETNYAKWYRAHEQPAMSDEEFYQADDFRIELPGFHQRVSNAN
ncbi:MAG: serine/threonine protein phosphatase [Pseudomonadota bacterium]